MGQLTVQPRHLLTLSSEELALVLQGLNEMVDSNGNKVPRAQRLRDDLSRQRAVQSIELGRHGKVVLDRLPPKDHDYGIEDDDV